MVKSRRHRNRKRSRKRRGGMLTPSMLKECKKANKKWHECAAHLADAAKTAGEAKKATPNMMATVIQAKAMQGVKDSAVKKAKIAKASAELMEKGVSEELRSKMAPLRAKLAPLRAKLGGKRRRKSKRRRSSRGGRKSRRKSRKSKRRRSRKRRR